MQTFKPVKSRIKTMHEKSFFMRKPRLINVLDSLIEIESVKLKKMLDKKCNFVTM